MEKFKEFITFKNLFIAGLVIAILMLSTCDNKNKNIKIVKIPEVVIKSDTVFIEKKINTIQIKYKDGTAVVNKDIYENYNKEIDTVKKKEIFVESITIREYKNTVIDNDTAKVIVNSKVQGKLLSVQADLFIKEKEIKLEINKNPRLSLVTGIDLYYNKLEFNPVINAGIQTRNGNTYKIGTALDKSVMIGFSKTFTIIK